jgi:hypothetical protein
VVSGRGDGGRAWRLLRADAALVLEWLRNNVINWL